MSSDQHDLASELINALKDLRVVEQSAPPPEVKRAIRRVLDAADEFGLFDAAPTETAPPETERARRDAGLAPEPRKPQRHDAKRDPSGHVYRHGGLLTWLTDHYSLPEQTSDDVHIAKSISRTLAIKASNHQLGRYREQLKALFEALFGHPWGQRWQAILEHVLYEDKRRREEQRLRELRGDLPEEALIDSGPPADGSGWFTLELVPREGNEVMPGELGFDPPMSDEEMLEHVRDLCGSRPPPETRLPPWTESWSSVHRAKLSRPSPSS